MAFNPNVSSFSGLVSSEVTTLTCRDVSPACIVAFVACVQVEPLSVDICIELLKSLLEASLLLPFVVNIVDKSKITSCSEVLSRLTVNIASPASAPLHYQ